MIFPRFTSSAFLLWVASSFLLAATSQLAHAEPSWWPREGGGTVNDYRLATAGQLKNMAAQAMISLNDALEDFHLPGGGAGEAVTRMVTVWPTVADPKNAQVINQAQLKAVAKPFYDRLAQLGLWPRGYHVFGSSIQGLSPVFSQLPYTTLGWWRPVPTAPAEWALTPRYPWKFWVPASFWAQNGRSTLGLQPANVGQLKFVFDFDPLSLLLNSGMVTNVTAADPNGQPVNSDANDFDQVPDLVEKLLGTNPNDPDSYLGSTNPYAAIEPTTMANPEGLSDAAAARFLMQATWGPSLESITHLKSKGINDWITEQMAESNSSYGFRPNERGMMELTWQDGTKSRWQVLWQAGWDGATAASAVDNRLFPNDQAFGTEGVQGYRKEEYWRPHQEAAKDILPALFPHLSAVDIPSYWHGDGGVVKYVENLVAGQSMLTLQQVWNYLTLGYTHTPPGGTPVAYKGLLDRQYDAFYDRLDAEWLMTGTVGDQQVTLPYAGYAGPVVAESNSSDYPGTLKSQSSHANATWAALRDTADMNERGPYDRAWFPQRGVEPYVFYLHWRKLVLDRPLWEAAVENGWITEPHHLSRVLPWTYQLGDVRRLDVQGTARAAWAGLEEAWLRRALYDPDQLRQRVAWALSQILVVSNYQNFAMERVGLPAVGHYDDLLNYRAFRRFEDLLLDVTFHPLMAHWLTYIDSKGADSMTDSELHPDENYAREIMQLFSMGLHELQEDGTPRLDAQGGKIFTYSQEDVRQLARVFTGMVSRTGLRPADCLPLRVDPGLHDVRSKSFLGLTLPARTHTSASAEKEIRDAVRHIARRPSVAPYICRQLIQHLVTSNPSPGYVRRVVGAWRANYNNADHLGQVVRAILEDVEARGADTALTGVGAGRMKDPMQRMLSLMRAFHAGADYAGGNYDLSRSDMHPLDGPLWGWGHYLGGDPSHPHDDFQQLPFLSPSVFSFYAPGYSPAGEVFNARLLGPEFQLLNSATATTVTSRLWLGTDFVRPALPARAPNDGYAVGIEGVTLKKNELVYNLVGQRFAQAGNADQNHFQMPVGSVYRGNDFTDYWLGNPMEGFSSNLYHADQKERFTRLWHDRPYTTPGSALTHQNKALRLHFGMVSSGAAPAIASPGDVAAVTAFLDQLDTLLCAGRLMPATRARLRVAISHASATPGDAHYRERAAVQALLLAPEASLVR